MPTYIMQPGNHVIHYPESCVKEPADLPSFLAEMEPSFRDLLSNVPHGRSSDMVIEAFGRSLFGSSPQYKVPYWQTYRFGPGKWPYGKWVLDKLRWFIADPTKLLRALANLENAKALERLESQPVQEIVIIEDDSSSKPTEVPSELVPVIPPEPPKDQSKLLAENDRLKKELSEARALIAQERIAHKASLEAKRQANDRRYLDSFIFEKDENGRAVNPFVKDPQRKFIPRDSPLKIVK